MIKQLLAVCSLLFLLLSCNRPAAELEEKQTVTHSQNNHHTIPVGSALSSLYSFLEYDGSISTKTNVLAVESIYTVRVNELLTKSTTQNLLDCDELVYLVNFEGDCGYAILAADDRISEDIISVVEQGSLSLEELLSDYDNDSSNVIHYNYPTEGPGILYDEDYPNDLFINPNTFTLYDEAYDDFYVGDYYFEEDSSSVTAMQHILNGLSLEFAISEISSYDLKRPIIDEEQLEGPETSVITNTQTVITSSVTPMLVAENQWRQTSPFNDFCPTVRKYILFGQTKNGYTGCVPLAISKILSFFEWPTHITFNGIYINWAELKSDYNSLVGSLSAAALLRFVGLECNSLYFYEGTFTFPSLARDFLTEMFFPNVSLLNYSTSSVVDMLDNGCPVFVCSVPHNGVLDYDLARSHSWNIDGYKNKQTMTTRDYYIDGNYSHSTTSYSNPSTLVHCDFGWQGSCNGYYASGLFKLYGSDIEFDNNNDPGKLVNYNDYLMIITYSRPY